MMQVDDQRRRRGGFTLIELLVVVAIIALLLSILLPSLQRARQQAQQLMCATNLRNMGQSAFLYAEANEEWVVRSESWRGNPRWGMHYAAALLPGLGYNGDPVNNLWHPNQTQRIRRACKQMDVFQCPNMPEENQPLDYVVNAFLDPYFKQPGDGPGTQTGDGPVSAFQDRVYFSKLSEIDQIRPSERIFITEMHQDMPDRRTRWGSMHDMFVPKHLSFASEPRMANDQRHPGGLNNLFFDGHVKVLALRRIDVGWPNQVWDRMRLFADASGY